MAEMEALEAEQAEAVLSRLMERVSFLQVKLRDSNWAELSKGGFMKEAGETLDKLTGLRKDLEEAFRYFKDSKELDLGALIGEYKKLENMLEKNIEFERTKESSIQEVHEQLKEEHPELFASLQQSALSLLLKTKFVLERSFLLLDKAKPAPEKAEKSKERNELVDLLQQKEGELQDLKQRYDNVKRNALLGFAHEENAAELERDMQKLGTKFERGREAFEGRLGEFRTVISGIQSEFMDLNERMEEIERIYSDYADKASELIMLLKKERDFAKKTALDIENEVLHLRVQYSRELLKFEENKAKIRSEAFAESEKMIQKLQTDLEDQEGMLKHLRDLAQRKEREVLEFKEKLAYANVAIKAREIGRQAQPEAQKGAGKLKSAGKRGHKRKPAKKKTAKKKKK